MTPEALRVIVAKIRQNAASSHFGDPRYAVVISSDKVDAITAAIPELLTQVTALERRLSIAAELTVGDHQQIQTCQQEQSTLKAKVTDLEAANDEARRFIRYLAREIDLLSKWWGEAKDGCANRDLLINQLEVKNAKLQRDGGETSAAIAEWQTATFGPATTRQDRLYRSWEAMDAAWEAVRDMDWNIHRPNLSRALRAAEELAELISRLVADDADPRACTEVADVQIVLAGIPAAHGQEQRDLVNAKMITNRARSWELTGDGHGQHVEEP